MNAQQSFPRDLRRGAGLTPGVRVSHHGRSSISRPTPVLALWRTHPGVGSLRGKKLYWQVEQAFRRCHRKLGFRVTHFAVRGAEVQMIVEADDTQRLSRGMQGLGVSMAKRINFSSRRHGPAFDDRFSARALRTPDDVARALGRLKAERPEFRSDGRPRKSGPALVAASRTWLMRIGRMRAALFPRTGPPRLPRTGPPRRPQRWWLPGPPWPWNRPPS